MQRFLVHTKYLPLTSSETNGWYKTNAIDVQNQFCQTATNPATNSNTVSNYKMMKNITFLLAVLTFCIIQAKAQNVKNSTIQWSSVKTMDINKGDSKYEATTLTSYNTSSLEWKNEDGSLRKTFQIIEIVGDWSNAATPGSLTFEVKDGTNSGTITIRKDDQNTRALLVIVTDPPQVTELTIQSSQVQ